MHRFHSTRSGQENLVTHTNQTTTKGNKSNLLSPVLNFRLAFGLLWIAPIVFLLWLNFNHSVIGGAAWCVKKPCGVIQYDLQSENNTNSLIEKHDQENHNLIGGLQFAAKALEVWFIYIASSLVYLVAYSLARRPGGLPTGHLLTYLEYTDLLWMFSRSLFKIPGGEPRRAVMNDRVHTAYLYLFTSVAVCMCIIGSLIGPSIAVLMLPTVRWYDSPHFNESFFVELEAGSPPAGDFIPGCTADNLSKPDYSCFQDRYGNDIDAMITDNAVMVDKANTEDLYTLQNSVVSYEGTLPFVYNTTNLKLNPDSTPPTTWTLSRQVLRSLSNDFEELYAISTGTQPTDPSYTKRFEDYQSSRSLVLQRQGPVIGMQVSYDYANLTTTTVDSGREVLCYHSNFEFEATTCFGARQRWNKGNKNYTIASFTINANGTEDLFPVKIRTYWSDRFQLFQSNFPDLCLVNGTATNSSLCDYDTLLPESLSESYLVMELSQPASPHPESVWVTMSSLSYGLATYTLDATTIFPNLQNVAVPSPPQNNETSPLVFNPAWVLAAWGINQGGSPSPSRHAVLKFQQSAHAAFQDNPVDPRDFSNFLGALVYIVAQAASLVTFTNSTVDSPVSEALHTNMRPVLWTNIRREVWGWTLETRTSKLGVVVAIAGILIVLVRTGLLIITREKERGSTEIIAAALQHQYDNEFGHAVEMSELARVRYQIEEEEGTGKLRFIPA